MSTIKVTPRFSDKALAWAICIPLMAAWAVLWVEDKIAMFFENRRKSHEQYPKRINGSGPR